MSDLDERPTELICVSSPEGDGTIELLEPRDVPLGGPRAMTVRRTLPQRGRSLIGAWCFLDHYGPDDVADTGGMVVPRHPHTGLATVSWLFTGSVDHLDSGGHAATVVPGELNLMIAGRGITHSEISTEATSILHGVQLWYAMPDSTRFGENEFIHYRPEAVSVPGMQARVFIGELLGSVSPVKTRTPELLGAELRLEPNAKVTIKVRSDFEHAVLAESADLSVNGTDLQYRSLAYIPIGSDTIELAAGPEGARVILLGGIPLNEQIVMWWNFTGRSHEEIVEYRRRYQAEMGFDEPHPDDTGKRPLFGDFPSGQRAPLPAPALPHVRLKPRA